MAVNLERLQEISGGDREFEREILQAFVEDAWVSLDLLKKFLTTNDYSAFSNQAHQLKGSSSNMGITVLQNIAFELDKKGEQQNLQGTEQDLEKIETILNELEDYLSKN
ncbi:Hpt domain-containing protein [Oscillatoria sp. HE19RPO]|uniref:Hpt domain-containing protein n=1 Tax=Oscillatoria sp. HE19RPO TaxID=2954806 RepID=UPI0020C33865|nr:Hpt domain-containing protein [Oscillatoria sp. HE19RPO]